MNNAAISYAKQQEELLRQKLADSYSTLSQIKDSQVNELTANKDRLLSAIDLQKAPIQSAYEDNSRQAYVNKVLSSNRLRDNLGRIGLSNTGYAGTQSAMLESGYSTGLGELQKTRDTGLMGLETQKTGVEQSYNTDLAGVNTKFLQGKADTDRYINEAATNVYDTAYKNYIAEEQRKIDNQMAQRAQALNEYNSRIKNTPTTNVINTAGGLLTHVTGGFDANKVQVIKSDGKTTYIDNVTGKKTTLDSNVNPFTGSRNKDTLFDGTNKVDPTKVFGNGYQPNNINGVKLKSVDKTEVYPGAVQSVWQAGNKKYVWDGQSNKYVEVIQKSGNWVVK